MNLQRIEGTFRHSWAGTQVAGAVDRDRIMHADLWFASAADSERDAFDAAALGARPIGDRVYESRAELRRRTDASPVLLDGCETYARAHGLEVVSRTWRSVVVRGTLHALTTAFGARVDLRLDPGGKTFADRSDWLHLPLHLANDASGIFGMHEWMHTRRAAPVPTHGRPPLKAKAIEQRYNFPPASGAGQTVAILSYASGFDADDFDLAMREQRVVRERPIVVHVDRERAGHRALMQTDVEAATDVQIVGALAPGARIVMYETPHDERGCLDALRAAILDEEHAPTILSISYGIVERHWTPSALAILDELFVAAALLGISVFVASGDHGAELDEAGHPHVNAPASSPYAIACGATAIDASRGREIAWSHTGGGFARRPLPNWQHAARTWAQSNGAHVGRGVPDVSGQCDPGYLVAVRGQVAAMGGTSTIAPMWAALTARLNERATSTYGVAQTLGFFAPLLYAAHESALRPITAGSNDFYKAGAGWNPCAGLGVPDGRGLERALLGH